MLTKDHEGWGKRLNPSASCLWQLRCHHKTPVPPQAAPCCAANSCPVCVLAAGPVLGEGEGGQGTTRGMQAGGMEPAGCRRVPWSPACCTCSRCRRSPAGGSSHHPPATPRGRGEEQRHSRPPPFPQASPPPHPTPKSTVPPCIDALEIPGDPQAPWEAGAGQGQAAARTGVCCSPKGPSPPSPRGLCRAVAVTTRRDTRILTTCFCLRGFTQKVPSLCWREESTRVGTGAEHPPTP